MYTKYLLKILLQTNFIKLFRLNFYEQNVKKFRTKFQLNFLHAMILYRNSFPTKNQHTPHPVHTASSSTGKNSISFSSFHKFSAHCTTMHYNENDNKNRSISIQDTELKSNIKLVYFFTSFWIFKNIFFCSKHSQNYNCRYLFSISIYILQTDCN